MKIGVKFNQLTYREYKYILDRHQKYTDFNPLALYRSIGENNKLNLDQKIAIRDLAHQQFFKFFEFLQIKDPIEYIEVSTLGETLTDAEYNRLWETIHKNGEKILKAKRIKHRNFGGYSKRPVFNGEDYDTVFLMSHPYQECRRDRAHPANRFGSYVHRTLKKKAARENKAEIANELIALDRLKYSNRQGC